MTRYVLDADVFIRARRDHYRFPVCPGFWHWLLLANRAGTVFSIDKVQAELTAGTDELVAWAKAQSTSFFLPTDSSVTVAAQAITAWAAGQSYEPQAIAQFFAAADYWLVAHALARSCTVVTHETSQPESKRRIKLPDACRGVGVACTNPFQLLEDEGGRFVLQEPASPPQQQ